VIAARPSEIIKRVGREPKVKRSY